MQYLNNSILSEKETTQKILGIWNLDVFPLTIGGLIIFIQELQVQQIIHRVNSVELCILGKDIKTACSYSIRDCSNIPSVIVGICDPSFSRLLSAISIIRDFSNISRCYFVSSYTEFQRTFQNNNDSYILWPDINEGKFDIYKYSNTRYLQQFFFNNGYIPIINCEEGTLNWVLHFFNMHVYPAVPVVVHLKNNLTTKNCSNADFNAWYGFFKHYVEKTGIKFILVGNEPIDPRILTLSNVVVTKNHESNISRDLALINQAAIFMGMSSGPCNIAIFSNVPFIIYKNPDHDVEEIKMELGKNIRFPFSTESQKILRMFETVENLIEEFNEAYSDLLLKKSKSATVTQ